MNENLNFGQALEALKSGKKVTRAIWEGYWFYDQPVVETYKPGYHMPEDREFMQPMIIAKLRTGELVPAQPYQLDLLAEDWKIVD